MCGGGGGGLQVKCWGHLSLVGGTDSVVVVTQNKVPVIYCTVYFLYFAKICSGVGDGQGLNI